MSVHVITVVGCQQPMEGYPHRFFVVDNVHLGPATGRKGATVSQTSSTDSRKSSLIQRHDRMHHGLPACEEIWPGV